MADKFVKLLFSTGSPLWWLGLVVIMVLRWVRYGLIVALARLVYCQARWPALYPLWRLLWNLGWRFVGGR